MPASSELIPGVALRQYEIDALQAGVAVANPCTQLGTVLDMLATVLSDVHGATKPFTRDGHSRSPRVPAAISSSRKGNFYRPGALKRANAKPVCVTCSAHRAAWIGRDLQRSGLSVIAQMQ